jgi:hypothetical protein
VEELEATKALLDGEGRIFSTSAVNILLELERVPVRRGKRSRGWEVTELLTKWTSSGEMDKIREMTKRVRTETLKTPPVDPPLGHMTEEALSDVELEWQRRQGGGGGSPLCQLVIFLDFGVTRDATCRHAMGASELIGREEVRG